MAEARGEVRQTGPALGDAQQRALGAVVLRILPSSGGEAGAREAGCAEYVLSVAENRLQPRSLEEIKKGLGFLESLSAQMTGLPFADAPEEEQDRVIGQLLATPHPTPHRFFRRVVRLTLEGFLGDPAHGGNRNRVGWTGLGLAGPSAPGACLGEDPCTTS